jgi:Zn-dependent metalloprotease
MNELIENNTNNAVKNIKIDRIIKTIERYEIYKQISYTIRVSCDSKEPDNITLFRIKHELSMMSDTQISSAYQNFKQYMEMYLKELQKLSLDNKLSDTGKTHLVMLSTDINDIISL